MDSWSLQDTKAKFSEFVRRVKAKGPHMVTLRGKPEIVVMTVRDYEALSAQKPSLLSLMRSSPLSGMELAAEREGKTREFAL
ncbi:MAG: type II toxin-antitoxin system Phd/YefM family antitoxin [Rhodospirillales bacterium]|nr:type II toxin-antitoxin system Phd/YefM family antitoxin [Alphaproteobacteria bacterium]MCB9987079.1 type II toxin-antitoxin system Phd/YefM family antitoxin [Rhodospirillales bacterium]USO08158.1 MAG: type II toxin-antitoxin system Phd/YefM family antitoxin [Rhodospirillales bacterium]